jgi:RNA polymerase sigma-70 factor (ECF subfamily)
MSATPSPKVESLLAHARWARSLARELVGDSHLADDLTQDALAAALVRPPEDPSRTQGWLARVLRNRQASNLRRADARGRAEPRAARAEAQPSTLDLVEQAETQRRLVECVLALEEPYRRTVLLRWFGDLPPREIARTENVPLATVTSRLTRAHAKLRERLERDYGNEGRSWLRALTPLALADLRPAVPLEPAADAAASVATETATATGAGLSASSALVGGAVLAGAAAALALVWSAVREFSTPGANSGANFDANPSKEERSSERAVANVGDERTDVSTRAALDAGDAAAPVAPSSSSAMLRGRAVFADGRPAAGARVGTGPLEWFDAQPKPAAFHEVLADADGRFELPLSNSRWRQLTATHADAAPSETLTLESRSLEFGSLKFGSLEANALDRNPPGAALAGDGELVLTLREGGRVLGTVFAPDGRPAAAREVRLMSDFGAGALVETTANDGRFAFAALPVGRWTILSFPSDAELSELRLGEPGSISPFEHLAQRTLEVRDGETLHVELGRAPEHPVVVEGRVTARGAPQSALLQFVGPGARALELQRVARTDADGHYRVALAEPGAYLVKITVFDAPGTHSVERVIEAPRAERWRHDLELPSGALRGRVLDARGEPVAGASVRLKRERGGTRSPLTSFSDARPTREDGSFAFERLEDGAWSLSVHKDSTAGAAAPARTTAGAAAPARTTAGAATPAGNTAGAATPANSTAGVATPANSTAGAATPAEITAEQGEVAKTAASVSAVLEVRDGRSVDDLVIRIANGALLRGVLSDERGAPVGLASVVVHSADGRLLTPFAWSASDLDGVFAGPALAPGEYWVHARSRERCSTPQRVVVRDGEALAPLELTLLRAGQVEVRFASAAEAAAATLSLRDASDREFAGIVDRANKSLDILTSFTPGRWRATSLPAGTYLLRVEIPARAPRVLQVAVEADGVTLVDGS